MQNRIGGPQGVADPADVVQRSEFAGPFAVLPNAPLEGSVGRIKQDPLISRLLYVELAVTAYEDIADDSKRVI